MTSVAAILLTAAAGFGFARLLGVPALPVLIVTGFVASQFVTVPAEFLQDAVILGVTLVVFVAGLELNPARVGRYRAAAVKVGLLQFLVLGGAGFGAALLLGFDMPTSAYVALALAASSTLVVLRLLQRRRQLYEPMGRMVTGVLLLQDALVVLLIPVATGIRAGGGEIVRGVLATLFLMALTGVLLRWVTPRVLPRLADDEESLLLAVLALLFLFLACAFFLEVPLIAGAFLAGVALSPFPVNALVRGQLNSLGDFFSAIFFTALGAVLALPTLDELVQALVLAGVVLAVTPLLVTLVAERTGFSARGGIGAGLLLSQTSEFSLVVVIQGLIAEQIGPGAFSVIALVTVLTMILTPVLATDPVVTALTRLHPLRQGRKDGKPPNDHVLLVGCGSNGMALLEMLIVTPNDVWVMDDDPAVVEQVREAGVSVVRGDASDPIALESAGAARARVIVSTVRRLEDNARLLSSARDAPVLVRAFNVEDERWIRERGGIPIPYSEAASQDFLEWFLEGKLPPEEEGGRRNTSPEPL